MKNIRQTKVFNTTPVELYNWFMDSKKHARFTGAKAKIGKQVGDKFSAWDGYIEGINLKLTPGKLIVQKWRGTDWADGEWSKATFKFSPLAGGKTKLEFTQTGVPDKEYKGVTSGWTEFYWNPLTAILKK